MSSTGTHTPATDDQPPVDLSGRTLGDFRLLRKLGQGGMGQVYLAFQSSLHRNVALKVLRPEMAASPKALARFDHEAKAVARITHANIVQVYAFGQEDGVLYMALEYVEGRNLREYIAKKGPPDLMVSLSIMRQVAGALQRASELGIIHRDIKPENILLTRKGEVKVADFGLSRCLESDKPVLNLTQTGVTMGTPLYMSPEQVEGKEVDSRTDIYSFGVTCYHMLAGHPPFRGNTAFEVAIAHVQKQPEPLSKIRPDLPEALCNIVHKMMAKDPQQRYQTGRDLLRDVLRVRESLSGVTGPVPQPSIQVDVAQLPTLTPTEPSETTTPVPTRSVGGQKAWLLVGMVLSLVAAAGIGAFMAWKDLSQQGPLPGGAKIRAADAGVVETITKPNERERALRLLVDQALNPPKDKAPEATNFTVCMQLGLLYLDENRLADAEKLFSRLEKFKEPRSFPMLGKTGRAIVMSLQNKATESNKLLQEVFATPQNLLGPFPRGLKKGNNPVAFRKYSEIHLAPILPLVEDRRGRDWLGRTRWYNNKNGITEDKVPRYLIYLFPLMEIRGKKGPDQKKKI